MFRHFNSKLEEALYTDIDEISRNDRIRQLTLLFHFGCDMYYSARRIVQKVSDYQLLLSKDKDNGLWTVYTANADLYKVLDYNSLNDAGIRKQLAVLLTNFERDRADVIKQIQYRKEKELSKNSTNNDASQIKEKPKWLESYKKQKNSR